VIEAASRFPGVPHRLQTVAEVEGVRYINSSIDTSPTRTAAALSAMEMPPVVITGGRTKGIPLDALGDALVKGAKAVFLYGDAADEILATLDGSVYAEKFDLFADAFAAASRYARVGDTVLLSPGCTAYDQFENFEKRGECFTALVKGLSEKG
jgi:UDP-N-acetylmuramoylalanine--D-glutamate ligase